MMTAIRNVSAPNTKANRPRKPGKAITRMQLPILTEFGAALE